jgi:hypothetical protein
MVMPTSTTTVEVKRSTARMLEELKKKYGCKSMDETLRRLISRAEDIPDSMFGSQPKMKPFGRKDEGRFHEL